MSDELQSENDDSGRPLFAKEKMLLRALINKAERLQLPEDWVERARVLPMDDGGMGSLRFQLPSNAVRTMSTRAAEVFFNDSDGVAVIASLNLDDLGWPLEIDVWKTDFSPLICLPDYFG